VEKRELVERAQRGDQEAFATLARASVARTDAAARLILRDPHWAQDAVQDAYLRAWRDLPALRQPERFDAWLNRLVANACYDQLRRRRRRAIEVDVAAIAEPEAPDPFAGGAVRDQIERALNTLSADERAIVVLHHYLGLPLPEAAPILGVPLGTAKSRLSRAVHAMRAALDEATGAEQTAGGSIR
jgi:RNA polymerase sigma-70 factor, ECF subfamily